MDLRQQIVEKVQMMICSVATDDVVDVVTDVITMVLHNYEIQERCTALIPINEEPDKLLKLFIASKRVEGLSENTIKRYATINKEFLDFVRKPICDIKTDDIRFFLSYRRRNDGVSNRTLDGMRRIYSSFFSWLAAEGHISINPCLAVKKIKYTAKVKKPFSQVELQKLREACKSDREIALIDFLYFSGCRVSEVSSANIEDIDFEKKTLVILGKGNKERTIYLTDVALMHLKKYIGKRSTGAIFIGKGTDRMTKNGIESVVKKIGIAAGINNVHCHRFRRTLATNLIQKGTNILTVAKILGHCDCRTTQIYCELNNFDVSTAYYAAFTA